MSTRTRTLRIALVTEHDGWIELTSPAASVDDVERLRVGALSDAARLSAAASRPTFLDIDVVLADSVNQAFLDFTDRHPDWYPGARSETITHPGTSRTLAGLLWDIWAVGVADGVTLRSADTDAPITKVIDEVLPILASRGLPLSFHTVSAA
ncbi:MAG: hypothetical protein QM809_12795 [Gordonia sp. (in: high G+C Gram-positive bacteria)]|uniref:hypothetical protein n=1 Tax=Gordonia sp. (in: high G+C Gram-positive bacteria) TaxID=84139 RepID=UPI0039E46EE5